MATCPLCNKGHITGSQKDMIQHCSNCGAMFPTAAYKEASKPRFSWFGRK